MDVIQSEEFESWIGNLRDHRAQLRIRARIERLIDGNAGDVKPVGEGISEIRLHYGPGYRVYFMQRGLVFVVLLCGGDKSSQDQDIKLAKRIALRWKE